LSEGIYVGEEYIPGSLGKTLVSAGHVPRPKFIYLFIYLLCFASKHHTIIALKKLGHHNSLTPITVGPLQNININIENRNN
jgi:hypothetical protein